MDIKDWCKFVFCPTGEWDFFLPVMKRWSFWSIPFDAPIKFVVITFVVCIVEIHLKHHFYNLDDNDDGDDDDDDDDDDDENDDKNSDDDYDEDYNNKDGVIMMMLIIMMMITN